MSIADNGTNKGGVLVSPPSCEPADFGLLSVAEMVDEPEGHWQTGILYEVQSCTDILILTPHCPPGEYMKPGAGGNLTTEYSDPFTLMASYECGAVGRPLSEAWDLAGSRLDRGEQRSLERAFWTGKDVEGNDIAPSLSENPDAVDLTPGAGTVDITTGLSILETWAGAEYPCEPIVHVNRGLATYLGERGLINAELATVSGSKVLTATGTGTRVAVGGGYGITGPGGDVPTAGEAWMFITGSILVRRSPAFFTPDRGDDAAAVDRYVNNITVFAERTYVFEQDCIVGAVRVNLQSCCG